MRVLYVVRLFSGLEEGLREGVWRPKGVPTIYRMIEALDRGPHELHLVFTVKDYGTSWADSVDRRFSVAGLLTPVTVLAGDKAFPAWLGRLRSRFALLRQMLRIWLIARRVRPDLIYFDRANLWPAAWAARLGRTPVVWRVMGVLEPMRDALRGRGLRNALWRWAFRSPFAAVICTLEGSGGEQWMQRALAPSVERHCLFNGVNVVEDGGPKVGGELPTGCTVVLFVGRLEHLKGGEEFIEALIAASTQAPGELHGVIVGDGSLRTELTEMVRGAGAGDWISFLGALPHETVMAWQRRGDIYVSLNRMGNLSNANLEALASGTCMVIPASQPEKGIDQYTDTFIPEDTALRFGTIDDVASLSATILHLHRNPKERAERGRRAASLAKKSLPSWDRRVAQELAVFERVAPRPMAAGLEAKQDA